MSTKKVFEGINILEVWDFRLSIGSPILYADSEFWKVVIYANDPGDQERIILDEHVTDVKTIGDPRDPEGVTACYEWLYSVRDKYSRDHIELRKPIAEAINEANAEAAAINGEALAAEKADDTDLANQKRGELQAHLTLSNLIIKGLTNDFHARVAEGGAA